MKYFSLALLLVLLNLPALSQKDGEGKPKGGGPGITGKIYGKIVDAETGKPIEYAVVQVMKSNAAKGDSGKVEVINGCLTLANGDFSVDKVPVGQPLTLDVSMVGFAAIQQTFTLKGGKGMMGAPEMDLGNIEIKAGVTTGEAVVEGSTDGFRIEFDKRVYDVDKNPINSGGTAEDVLKNVPSVQVDVDGNVTVRNSPPQIFVDGRPTTLTIDQIPADAIQRVEVITNPSAKYDASGGAGGIINIVMKHNRGMGYFGSLRAGIDMRKRVNGGLDLNVREGKLNFFVNANVNRRKSISTGTTDRVNYLYQPITYLSQTQKTVNENLFGNGKVGLDWFVDNRNTITFSESYTKGRFASADSILARTDSSLTASDAYSIYNRVSSPVRNFNNLGSSILYKHLFSKEGKEISADINFNKIASVFEGFYDNTYNTGIRSQQKQTGGAKQELYTSQVDFTNLLSSSWKLEAGARGAIRHYQSSYKNFSYDSTLADYKELKRLLVNYEYLDQVYAAYGTISKDSEKWKYQIGLRLESSKYGGKLIDTSLTFSNSYPLSVFPSLFLTRIINEKQDIQLAVSRKISRPSFMQLIPFVDYSDSLNINVGNPSLLPEFTNLMELSYQYTRSRQNVFIASAYIRYTTDLTVRNQIFNYSPVLNRNVVINTYDNAKSSTAAGLELVARNSLTKWLDITNNFNLYYSSIDGTNISPNLTQSRTSWWFKSNAIFKLPKAFTLQVLFEYTSKRSLEVGSSERGGGGGGGGGMGGMGGGGYGGGGNTVQGYVRPTYALDLSLKKEFTKSKNISLTLSYNDALRSRVNYTHSETPYFIQDTFKRRDARFLRLQFGWKFGKVDSSVFRRKNSKQGGEGMEG
jgi:outer membrane receptor protein involved in Fe transport